MASVKPHKKNQFKGHLSRRIISVLIPLILIPSLLFGAGAFYYVVNIVRNQSHNFMTILTDSQSERIKSEINQWQIQLTQVASDPNIISNIHLLESNTNKASSSYLKTKSLLINSIKKANFPKAIFNQFILVNPDGEIMAATIPNWEGEKISQYDLKHLVKNNISSTIGFAPEPLYAKRNKIEKFVITTSYPIKDSKGTLIATILAISEKPLVLELARKASIFSDNNFFLTTNGEFIGYDEKKNDIYLVEDPSIYQESFKDYLSTKSGFKSNQKVAEIESFNGTPVISAINAIPELTIGWVAEISRDKIYAGISNFLVLFLVSLFIFLIIISYFIWFMTNKQIQPLTELTESVQEFTSGNWNKRVKITRDDEIGLLAYSFNQMADELSELYVGLENEVEQRTSQVKSFTEISNIALSSTNLDELISKAAEFFVSHFDLSYTGAYILEESTTHGSQMLTLKQYAGSNNSKVNIETNELNKILDQIKLEQSPQIIYDYDDNYSFLSVSDIEKEVDPTSVPLDFQASNPDLIPADNANTITEAWIPISISKQILGVFHIYKEQQDKDNGITNQDVEEIQMLLQHLAHPIKTFIVLESTKTNLEETYLQYQVIQEIASATTSEEVTEIIEKIIMQTPYDSILFFKENQNLTMIQAAPGRVRKSIQPFSSSEKFFSILEKSNLHRIQLEEIQAMGLHKGIMYFPGTIEVLPKPVSDISQILNWTGTALFPIMRRGKVIALFLLGIFSDTSQDGSLQPKNEALTFKDINLNPYANIIEQAVTEIEKIKTEYKLKEHVIELESFSEVSKTLSSEFTLSNIFQTVHQQIQKKLGDVDFFVALFNNNLNLIEIPYFAEDESLREIPSYPLGNDLISSIINNKKPLRIGEENQTHEEIMILPDLIKKVEFLLGVPLIINDECIGTIVIQNNNDRNPFTAQDEAFLNALASQVSIAIRNAELIETSIKKVEREQLLNEITNQIRQSTDIQSILKTTVMALGTALGAKRADIKIQVAAQDNNGHHGKNGNNGHHSDSDTNWNSKFHTTGD